MKFHWHVDEGTKVEADLSAFGKEVVSVNGKVVVSRRSMRMSGDLPISLEDGRAGTLTVKTQVYGRPDVELRIDGRLITEGSNKSMTCASCGAVVRSFDRFCDECGKPLASPEEREQSKKLKEATSVIASLAALFSIVGVVMFLISRDQANEALLQLAALDDAAQLPIAGVTKTVAEWRDQVSWEPWGVLLSHVVLAGVMIVLALWSKRAPLAAVLVATATYAAIIVVSAIIDPTTLGQGLYVKVLIIALFWKGLKAGLALRAHKQAEPATIIGAPNV